MRRRRRRGRKRRRGRHVVDYITPGGVMVN